MCWIFLHSFKCQIERNKQLGVKDFYLVQLAGGEVEFCGDILTYLLNDRLFICRSTYKAPLLRDGNLPDFDLGFDDLKQYALNYAWEKPHKGSCSYYVITD